VALEIFFTARRLIYSRLIQRPRGIGAGGRGRKGMVPGEVRAREGGKINARLQFSPGGDATGDTARHQTKSG